MMEEILNTYLNMFKKLKVYSRRNIFIIFILFSIDSLLYSFLFLGIIKKKKIPNQINNVLLAHPGHIGDLLILTGLIKELRIKFPNVNISLVSSSSNREVIDLFIKVDNIYYLDHWITNRERLTLFAKFYIYLQGVVKLYYESKEIHYDIAVIPYDLSPSFIPVTSLLRPKAIIGYYSAGFGAFLTNPLRYDQNPSTSEFYRQQLPLYHNGLINQINYNYDFSKYSTFSNDVLNNNKKIPKAPYVIFHCEAGLSAKQANYFLWERIINHIGKHNYPIVFTGISQYSKNLCNVLSELNNKFIIIDLIGVLSFSEFVHVVKSSLFVCAVDSSVIHIAAGFGVPTAGLYTGISNINRWKPSGDKFKSFIKEMPCSPCGKFYCNNRPCINNINIDSVEEYFLKNKE